MEDFPSKHRVRDTGPHLESNTVTKLDFPKWDRYERVAKGEKKHRLRELRPKEDRLFHTTTNQTFKNPGRFGR